LVTLGQVHVLRKGNVVNVDVNPFPSPDFPLSFNSPMLVGLFSSAGAKVQPGMQTEGYEHEHELLLASS
jgi:hypothetical protein